MSIAPKTTLPTNLSQASERVQQSVNAYSEGSDFELVRIPLDEIGDRAQGNTRPLSSDQVKALAESIKEIGLIAPLAIDQSNRLLAGGHRLAALKAIRDSDPSRFDELFAGKIPCRQFSFDSASNREQALSIEISENEKRYNYTREEILALASRLKDLGYTQERGRKEKPGLVPTLATAFGVSRKTIERALREQPTDIATNVAISKRRYQFWLEEELAVELEDLAKQHGQKIPEFLKALVGERLKQAELRTPPHGSNPEE